MFSALVERGDIKAVVNGHDHINTFMVEYKGIKLCQAGKVTTLDYHDETILGARVLTFNGSNPAEVDTYMSYLDGRIERYTPTSAKGGNATNTGVNTQYSVAPELKKADAGLKYIKNLQINANVYSLKNRLNDKLCLYKLSVNGKVYRNV